MEGIPLGFTLVICPQLQGVLPCWFSSAQSVANSIDWYSSGMCLVSDTWGNDGHIRLGRGKILWIQCMFKNPKLEYHVLDRSPARQSFRLTILIFIKYIFSKLLTCQDISSKKFMFCLGLLLIEIQTRSMHQWAHRSSKGLRWIIESSGSSLALT